MKKVVITIILLLILIPTCYLTYRYFTQDNSSTPSNEPVSEELKGDFKNYDIKVDASLATQPLMDAYLNYFMDSKNSFISKYGKLFYQYLGTEEKLFMCKRQKRYAENVKR